MGQNSTFKGQFIDVIDCVDEESQTVVVKYVRPHGDNNEIKKGAKVIVRPSQAAVFVKGGQLADILTEGTHKIDTKNLPILSTLMAFPYLFNSPIKADLYFVSLKQFVNNSWETKNHLIVRDKEFNVVRIKGRGKFSFRINNIEIFIREIFGVQKKFSTEQINEYLCSFLDEAFNVVIGELKIPIIDVALHHEKISKLVMIKANSKISNLGIQFCNLNIENITLPESVEKLIDEQSGIGMASKNMDGFIQYQSARAIRDAAQQPGGIAGIGASFAVGSRISKSIGNLTCENDELTKIKCMKCQTVNDATSKYCSNCGECLDGDGDKSPSDVVSKDSEHMISSSSEYAKLREYKLLLDDGIISNDEFKMIKQNLLN